MKGKGTGKRWMCAILMMVLLCTMPGTALGAENEAAVEWTYDDSILVNVMVDESRTFSPGDFPGIDCKKVFVLEKKQEVRGFEYKLVLMLRHSGKEVLEKAINEVLKQPMVIQAGRNEEYIQRKSILNLNQSCLYLEVGETANLFIKDLDLSMPKEYRIWGVKYELNQALYNPDSFQKNSFSAYGVSRFWPETEHGYYILALQPENLEAQKSESGIYYGLSSDVFGAMARLAAAQEISSVSIAENCSSFIIVGEEELWKMKNPDIAECSLSGGSKEAPDIVDPHVVTPLNQNAAIQGLELGITTLTCERRGRKGMASANCLVIVYEPGSKNNPGDMDHNGAVDAKDALQVLKHSVELVSLDEADRETADLNQDNKVDAIDALLMLKIAVGCL